MIKLIIIIIGLALLLLEIYYPIITIAAIASISVILLYNTFKNNDLQSTIKTEEIVVIFLYFMVCINIADMYLYFN